MRKHWFFAVLASVLVLSGCASTSSDNSSSSSTSVASTESFEGTYYKMIYKGREKNAENFYLNFSGSKDLVTIGSGLEYLSTKRFSTKKYYMSDGVQFTSSDFTQLLKRDAEGTADDDKEYPYTLQPEHGTTLDGVEDPVMITTIVEQDFYTKSSKGKYKIKGTSFAIILDPSDEDGQALETEMSTKTIKKYSQQCIEGLYKYIRKKKKKLKNLPTLITIYEANNDEVSLINGNFLYQAYCDDGDVGTMKKVNHKNVYFLSDDAEELDPTTYADFTTIKAALKNASYEAAGLIGEGKYIDGEIQSMKMEAHLNIKTYTEMLYLTSVLADKIDSKFTQDFQVSCLVYTQDELMAVIIKKKGGDAETTIVEQ